MMRVRAEVGGGRRHKQPNLIWSEEFTSPLDLTTGSHVGRWRPNDHWRQIDLGWAADNTWYLNPNQHPAHSTFSVGDGVLSVCARRNPGIPGIDKPWLGADLVTNKDLQTFRYGYFEFRARFPNAGRGMMPAIWLFVADGGAVPHAKGEAEIDLIEVFGYAGADPFVTTYHIRNYASVGEGKTLGWFRNDHPADWHVWALDWQPSHLRFYRDGALYAEVTGPDAAYFDVPMSIRLSYVVDADWFPEKDRSDATTPDELVMQLDHIRVYDRMPA